MAYRKKSARRAKRAAPKRRRGVSRAAPRRASRGRSKSRKSAGRGQTVRIVLEQPGSLSAAYTPQPQTGPRAGKAMF